MVYGILQKATTQFRVKKSTQFRAIALCGSVDTVRKLTNAMVSTAARYSDRKMVTVNQSWKLMIFWSMLYIRTDLLGSQPGLAFL